MKNNQMNQLKQIDDEKIFNVDGITGKLLSFEINPRDYVWMKTEIERLEKENKSLKEKAYRNTLSKLSDSDFGRIL